MRILFLCHRCPYPPDKGEKITSYNFIKYLAARHELHAGFLVDDPDDVQHVPTLAALCASVHGAPITSRERALRTLLSARPGRALTHDWFRSPSLQSWVDARLPHTDAICVYSSAMAPYVAASRLPTLLHMADVDSEKWREYARTAPFPKSALYARETRNLLALERRAAAQAARTTFVSPAEAAVFAALAPEVAARCGAIENGVDLDYFAPGAGPPETPYAENTRPITFTGTMGYKPNIDAVTWFADEIFPKILAAEPAAEFWIVGNRPAPAVTALAARPHIHVTGGVPDIRPYMRDAACLVAPLRLARGIQNKVIEAMAMARPVVTTPDAFEGIRATAPDDLLVADGPDAFAATVLGVLAGHHPAIPANARAKMVAGYAWTATLAPLDDIFPPAMDARPPDVLHHARAEDTAP